MQKLTTILSLVKINIVQDLYILFKCARLLLASCKKGLETYTVLKPEVEVGIKWLDSSSETLLIHFANPQ